MVNVGLVQLAVDSNEAVADRISRGLWMADQAAQAADVVVLPELWPAGAFDLEASVEHAEPINGPLVKALSKIASKQNVWLHGGSFVEVDDTGRHFNTSVAFGPDGSFAAIYRKIHLFGFDSGEAAVLEGGQDIVVVNSPLGRTGLSTCYDLRFPELFREQMSRAAQAMVMCSGWPTSRIARWTVLATARAIENQTWFVGCNAVGTNGGVKMGGESLIVDPWGEVVVQADDTEQILYADIDPNYPDQVRADFPVLRDRVL